MHQVEQEFARTKQETKHCIKPFVKFATFSGFTRKSDSKTSKESKRIARKGGGTKQKHASQQGSCQEEFNVKLAA